MTVGAASRGDATQQRCGNTRFEYLLEELLYARNSRTTVPGRSECIPMNSRPDPEPAPVATTYRSPAIRLLRALGHLLPGDYLKTLFYLNVIETPRRLLRKALFQFYRYDHVYVVLRDCKKRYRGRFSILEFGTSAGYSFVKLLYATRFLGLEDRVTVHGFDSFEGMPRA